MHNTYKHDLEDFNKYYIVQMWDKNDLSADNLRPFVDYVANELIKRNGVKVNGIGGPTFWLPDFFSELYGKQAGYLISVEKNVNPYNIKRTCMELERNDKNQRICDIDVYISREVEKYTDCTGKECTSSVFKSIHRNDILLNKFKEHYKLNSVWKELEEKQRLT